MGGNIDGICAVCAKDVALPVVFVPGIMGSRLRQTRGERLNVWDPVSGLFLRQYAGASAVNRRRLVIGDTGSYFEPDFLSVDFASPDWLSDHVPEHEAAEKHRRGWGGLVWDFYGPFLQWLETQAVNILASGDQRLGSVKIEAFAEPYNWVGDNGASAEGLNYRVGQAMSETAEKYAGTDRLILKPIVISHSMGGLVTRAFAKNQPNASHVAAIIHGAMPTQGSPAAYKRLLAGFEGSASVALGFTGDQVTAVGANSPGVLELLPSQFHEDRDGNTKWLHLRDAAGETLLSLPNADPFSEIYERGDVWWGPVKADEIDPEDRDPLQQAVAWGSYRRNLNIAKSFHAHLGAGASGFHPNTYMLFSDSTDFLCWDQVEWIAQTPIRQNYGATEDVTIWGIPVAESRNVERLDASDLSDVQRTAMLSAPDVSTWRVEVGGGDAIQAVLDLGTNIAEDGSGIEAEGVAAMPGANAAGDGTVHSGSGIRVPSSIESDPTRTASGGLAGYSHDQCYNSNDVRIQVAAWLLEEALQQVPA